MQTDLILSVRGDTSRTSSSDFNRQRLQRADCLFTPDDAYMRDYEIFVPSDCCASNEKGANEHALREMATVLKADITPSDKLDLEALKTKKEEDEEKETKGEAQFPKKSAPDKSGG